MNRRELLTGAAVLAGVTQANAFGIGKEGASGGFGHAGAVLGRAVGSGKLPFQSSIVAAGDSITANGWTNSSTQALIDNRSWWNWANNLGGNPFKLLANSGAGVGGNSSGQLLTRYTTDVTSKNPKVVTILIGTNDLASVDPNTTISNIAAMLSANAGIGAKTVLLKILPRGGHAIAVMTPTQITAWETVNNWIATQGTNSVVVVDAEPVLGAMDANHTTISGMFDPADELHPIALGGYTLGKLVKSAYLTLGTPGDFLLQTNNNAANYLANGFMTGTAGTKAGGTTGNVADGWTVGPSVALGGVATMVASKVARVDGFGEWQRIVVSGTYTGNNKRVVCQKSVDLTGLWSAGDIVQLACEVQVDAGITGVNGVDMTVAPTGATMQAHQNYTTTPLPTEAWTGTLRSPPFALPSNAGVTTFDVRLSLINTATTDSVSAAVNFGRLQAIKP